eukprot:6998200-Prymnesium_polylepis.1
MIWPTGKSSSVEGAAVECATEFFRVGPSPSLFRFFVPVGIPASAATVETLCERFFGPASMVLTLPRLLGANPPSTTLA